MIEMNYPQKEQFKFWFLKSNVEGKYKVFNMADGAEVGEYDTINPVNNNVEWLGDFELYKLRPEYLVGLPVPSDKLKSIETYETLIVGLAAIKSKEMCPNIDPSMPRYSACISYLESTDFFFAPASTQYHEAYANGLLEHTLKVYNEIISLMKLDKFNNVSLISAVLCALSHDWCKIGNYESYKKNVKDETTGKWRQEDAYRKNMRGVPLGHGTTSMMLAQKFFGLTTDEALAIRWHMGAWYVCDSELSELQLANETYPLVHLLQFADQLAIVNY